MSVDKGQLGFLGTIMELLDKYGLAKILLAIGVIALLVWAFNSENTVDKLINRALEQKNETYIKDEIEAINQRISVQDEVDKTLGKLINETDADRAFILELHNGTNNTAGLPFAYAEMTYEMSKQGIPDISDEYTKLLITKYKLPLYVYKNGLWYGSVESLIELDRKLGLKLMSNDAKYFMLIRLNGFHRNNTIGFLGITFVENEIPDNIDKCRVSLFSSSQVLAILLDTVDNSQTQD